MPHITVRKDLPGIVGLLNQFPETAAPLRALAQVLLRSTESLTPGERELIATYVSGLNECQFCCLSHRAAAVELLGDNSAPLVDAVIDGSVDAAGSPKLRYLLAIARQVQRGGRSVSDELVAEARQAGADDRAIHDTVLIAAAFCMFNRYVDGLATISSGDPADYIPDGKFLAQHGYLRSSAPPAGEVPHS